MERGSYPIETANDTTHLRDLEGTHTGRPISRMTMNVKRNESSTREDFCKSPIRPANHTSEENNYNVLDAPVGNSDDFPTISQLQLEIKRLNEEKRCKICLDNDSEIVFRPCGHFASCNTCAISLKNCPMCRKEIASCFRVYIA